ncbi:hypothetical protein, partial [Dermacoccus nishinomiyaensis]|uniref:hypothetical protein n=1 Tax=Dermacoccus nishinomiyaensis TaxID=1274 RepID=UPI001C92E355
WMVGFGGDGEVGRAGDDALGVEVGVEGEGICGSRTEVAGVEEEGGRVGEGVGVGVGVGLGDGVGVVEWRDGGGG